MRMSFLCRTVQFCVPWNIEQKERFTLVCLILSQLQLSLAIHTILHGTSRRCCFRPLEIFRIQQPAIFFKDFKTPRLQIFQKIHNSHTAETGWTRVCHSDVPKEDTCQGTGYSVLWLLKLLIWCLEATSSSAVNHGLLNSIKLPFLGFIRDVNTFTIGMVTSEHAIVLHYP